MNSFGLFLGIYSSANRERGRDGNEKTMSKFVGFNFEIIMQIFEYFNAVRFEDNDEVKIEI
jgi:hypothetical protein